MRWLKVLRYTLFGLLGLVLLLAAGAVGGFVWLRSDGGLRWLSATIEGAAASPDMTLTVEGLTGSIPSDLDIDRITVADSQGVWLTLERVRLELALSALLTRRVSVEELSAGSVTVARAPITTQPAPPEEPASGGGPVPDLPVGIAVKRLAVDRLILEEPLAGQRAVLRVEGSGRLAAGADAAEARIDVGRIDDRPGQVTLDAAFDPSERTLRLALKASEPAGGVIAQAAGIPGLPPVSVTLDGQGTLDDWTGRLVATAEGVARATADATVTAVAEGHAITLAAGADAARLLGPELAPLLGDAPSLKAEILIGGNGAVNLRPATLTTAAATVALSGTVDTAANRMDLAYEVTAGGASALRGLLPGASWREGRIAGTARGPLDALAVAVNAAVEGLSLGDPALDPLTGPRLALDARALVNTATGDVRLEGLELATPPATAKAQGTVGGWGQTADIGLTLTADDLSRLAALAGQPLAGAGTIDGRVTRGADGALALTLDGALRQLATGTPADAALGPSPTLRARAALAPDGAATMPELRVEGANASLNATASLVNGRVQAQATVAVPELRPIGEAAGTPMQGGITLRADVTGTPEAPAVEARLDGRDLVVGGRRIGEAQVTATATGLPTAPQGRVTARAGLNGQPLTAGATYALDGQTLRVSDLAVATGENRIGGAVTVALDTLLADGRLEGRLPALAAFSELAGVPLRGDASFTVALDGRDGRQGATLTASANGLRVEGDGAPLFEARRLTANAQVADALGNPSGKARLELQDGSASGTAITSATATAEGSLARAGFTAAVNGAGERAPSLDLAGSVAGDGDLTRVRVERLQGSFQGESFRLAGPATLTVGPQRYGVADLRLVSGGARLSVDGGLTDGGLNGKLSIDQLPLALARLADPSLRLAGALNATATLGGTLRDPRAELTLRASDVKAQQTTSNGVPGLDATVNAQWRDRRVSVDGTLGTRGGQATMTFAARAPLVLAPDTMAVSVPPNGGLEASADGTVNLSLLNDLLAGSGDRVQGTLRLDVKAGGTVGNPRLGGTVTLAGGRYEGRATGAVVTDIAARIVGDGDVFTIQSFTGRTPNGGTLRASGSIRPAATDGRALDLRVTANDARLLQTDIVTALFDADLALTGALDDSRLSGPVKVERAEVQVPNRLPPNVVALDVVEVGGNRRGRGTPTPVPPRKPGATPAAAAAPTPPPAAGPNIALDITINAPNQIFVRGRGLDLELGGQLKVGGTAAAPRISGRLRSLEGELSLIGQTFTFTRVNVDFDGTIPPDPRLDVVAEASANGVTAQVLVTGTATNPKLELASPQGLPQDEVLARVLFGKSANKLGAGEAVQLAQSAAQLAGLGGNGGGLLERVRRGLGVDRLEFNQGENGRGGAVEAGRYVSDNVYVGVEQGIGGTAQSRAKVEVDITDNIQAEADVGSNASPRVGLKFEWNY
ncbi:translocation/assembly module TamB domain-containing protein [Azospirillum oleiclasticum]|uniref:translocation/assembly module TamB domain-containing protein n=1 Tax=Azospirillum oleiclasticum TaxID=2735135 RepID=UPI003CCDB0E0